jgi:hypothetical protein
VGPLGTAPDTVTPKEENNVYKVPLIDECVNMGLRARFKTHDAMHASPQYTDAGAMRIKILVEPSGESCSGGQV